ISNEGKSVPTDRYEVAQAHSNSVYKFKFEKDRYYLNYLQSWIVESSKRNFQLYGFLLAMEEFDLTLTISYMIKTKYMFNISVCVHLLTLHLFLAFYKTNIIWYMNSGKSQGYFLKKIFALCSEIEGSQGFMFNKNQFIMMYKGKTTSRKEMNTHYAHHGEQLISNLQSVAWQALQGHHQ
ncbi:hypothetical protein ACJX0J_036903, partial [Zea mays]